MIRRIEPASLPLARGIDEALAPKRVELRLADGYTTAVYEHNPRGSETRLPVLHMHGIQSHPGWFMASASHLAGRGHPVFQVTRRGSGESKTGRGHAESADQLLEDIDEAILMIRSRTGADRVHLLGVSWGGKLLACYAMRAGAEAVASLTMVAPGIAPRVDVSPWKKLAIAASLLVAPKKRFAVPLNEPELFTDSPPLREFIRSDNFALRRATARLLFASRELDKMIARAADGSLTVPTALLLAGRDRIIDNARTRSAVDRLTAGRAAVQEFPASHVLEFEKDPSAYFEALANSLR